MPEITALRTATTKTHDNGDGTRTLEAFSGAIHYESNGQFHEIDRSIVPSNRAGYDWMNAANDFEFHFKENLNQDASILFVRGGIEIASRPRGVALHRADNGAHLVLGTPSDTTCVVDGRTITFSGLYPHCQVRYQSTANGIKEFIRMTSFNGIPDPLDYGINPAVVRIGFITELSPTGHDSITDGEDGQPVEDVDHELIHFKKGAETPITIPKLVAWSEGGDGRRVLRNVTKRIKQIGGKPCLIHGMMYTDLVTRPLPYIIDASWSGSVITGNDDGYWATQGDFLNNLDQINIGHIDPAKTASYKCHGFFRFTNLTIPQGSTITTGGLILYRIVTSGGATSSVQVHAEDVDDSVAPLSYGQAEAMVPTTAYSSTSVGSGGAGNQTFNIVDATQEVIDRPGWSSGNSLQIIIYSLGSATTQRSSVFAAYEHLVYDAPALSITYTDPPPPAGWTGTINGATNPVAVSGVAVADITEINGVA